MTYVNGDPRLVRELLQLEFPQPQPVAVASAAVGGDQQTAGPGIEMPTFCAPPAAKRRDRELTGVMVSADIHEPAVAAGVLDAVAATIGPPSPEGREGLSRP